VVVSDAALTTLAAPDPISAAISATEDRLVRELARLDLAELLSARDRLETSTAGHVSAVTSTWGVQIEDVELADVEVRLTQDLIAQLTGGG
jgi:regulator of protease activity HflC (stomatin/prohibitin superfamily)